MKQDKKETIVIPTKEQIEKERKYYRWKKAYLKALGGTVYVLTFVAAITVLISTLVIPVLQIEGSSMAPTLENGDIVLLTKTNAFEHGDICGFSWNNKLLIKRVVGLPGDWIEMDKNGVVYVNGLALDEPYVMQKSYGECDLQFPYQVPAEQYFVLGDMRESSIDSRHTLVGCIESDQILGKVFLRVWPISNIELF